VLAVVGVAGTTETGAVDDLQAIAALCQRYGGIHFHVDAAWGGPLVFSAKHRPKLRGIALANSITVDGTANVCVAAGADEGPRTLMRRRPWSTFLACPAAHAGHKQLYTPMGCGVVLFRDPQLAQSIRKTASYIIRQESFDAGKFSAEGSRAANVVYLHASLSLIGVRGFEALLDRSTALVQALADRLREMPEFEVAFPPTTNILLYRWIPRAYRDRLARGELTPEDQHEITRQNQALQALQTQKGQGFVSRTTIFSPKYRLSLGVLRIVIANPLVTPAHLVVVLQEQLALAATLEGDGAAAPPAAAAATAAAALLGRPTSC